VTPPNPPLDRFGLPSKSRLYIDNRPELWSHCCLTSWHNGVYCGHKGWLYRTQSPIDQCQ